MKHLLRKILRLRSQRIMQELMCCPLISVFVVVMFSFQSVLVPIIVMIPIEAAIYINMAVPYLVGETLVYMGYIIVSSIQLGATVDYSILLY